MCVCVYCDLITHKIRRVLKQFYLAGVHFQPPAKSVQAGEKKDETDEAQPLLGGQHTWISYVHV